MTSQNNLLLGQVTSLLLTSEVHRRWYLGSLARLIVPAIAYDKIVTDYDNDDNLIGFATWAILSPEAEHGYKTRTRLLQPEDFNNTKGNFWCIDLVAPQGPKQVSRIAKAVRNVGSLTVGTDSTGYWMRSHRNHFGTAKGR
jgi:hemolysin-activating ACP:hemolysin acyltransferase